MEDYELDIIIGQGPGARSVKVPLQRFTLMGATTRTGLLTAPLRARFGIVHRLDFYEEGDIREIVQRSARILDVPIEEDAAGEIARRSRGTPRVANRCCGGSAITRRCGLTAASPRSRRAGAQDAGGRRARVR